MSLLSTSYLNRSLHFISFFAHRLVVLFYALNYLCSVFDSSAEKKKKSLKKTSNSNSEQTNLTKWGEGISPVEIFAPPQSFTLEERLL